MIQRSVSEKDHLTGGDHMIAGAVSGLVTRFLCQPFDVVKIRFQVRTTCEPFSNAGAVLRLLPQFFWCPSERLGTIVPHFWTIAQGE